MQVSSTVCGSSLNLRLISVVHGAQQSEIVPEYTGSLSCDKHSSLKLRLISVVHGAQQSEIVPEYNGSLSCDKHRACSQITH